MATNSFDEKYKKNIEGLAKANNVDMNDAADMLRSNLSGTTQYQGGGVLDFNTANADLQSYLSSPEARGNSGGSGSSGYDDSNERYLTKLASERENARIAALRKSIDSTVAGYEEDIKNIPKQYQPLKDQTEINRYTSEKSLKEMLANGGQTVSGFGRTEMLNLHTGQNKELSTINATEQAAVDKLKFAINQAREAGSQEELAIKSEATADLMERLYNERLRAAKESKEDFTNTAGAYSGNYQAQIDSLIASGVSENDYRVKLLKAMQNEEKRQKTAAEAEAEQRAFENWLKEQANSRENAETSYTINKPYYKPSSGGGSGSNMTASQAMTAWKAGIRTVDVVSAMQQHYGSNFAETASIANTDTLKAIQAGAQSAMESVPAGTPQKQYVMASAAIKYLQNAVDTYQLTEAQAEKIARNMGINL